LIVILRDNWKVWPLFDGKNRIYLKCPLCGCECALDHDVDPNGYVNPSVVCPNKPDGKTCTFHEFVVLDGWDHGHHKGEGWKS
jgi:hypothetical protein